MPPPFGGKYRQIMVYVNREESQARGLTLMDVVHALNDANLIIPAGDAKIGASDYFIYTDSMIEDPNDINDVPVKVGAGQAPVFVRDIGRAEDAAQIQQNIVRINGQRSVYIPVLKQGNANTIAIVNGVRELLPQTFRLPAGMQTGIDLRPIDVHSAPRSVPSSTSGFGRGARCADDPDLPRQLQVERSRSSSRFPLSIWPAPSGST